MYNLYVYFRWKCWFQCKKYYIITRRKKYSSPKQSLIAINKSHRGENSEIPGNNPCIVPSISLMGIQNVNWLILTSRLLGCSDKLLTGEKYITTTDLFIAVSFNYSCISVLVFFGKILFILVMIKGFCVCLHHSF